MALDASRLTGPDAPGATDPLAVPREERPSWERYTTEEERTLSFESLVLLDGLVSYLAAVVLDHVPPARWEIARDRIKRYHLNNHPVLVSGKGEIHNFLPDVPWPMRAPRSAGRGNHRVDTIAAYARGLIEQLGPAAGGAAGPVAPEPVLEVEDIRDETGKYDFEIGLSDELAHERSADVDRLLRELAGENGVAKVLREDRDLILVRAPSWSKDGLLAWVSKRI